MKEILILLMSPHAGGVTDSLGRYFAAGLSQGSHSVRILALRDYSFQSCDGCNSCYAAPHKCKFADKDDLSFLYSSLENAALAVLVSPIYFYALPALSIAFIDRAQSLWNGSKGNILKKAFPPGIALFAAARTMGQKLFTGASLCLSSFFTTIGSSLLVKYAFRDLDNISTLESRPRIKRFLYNKGRDWAIYLSLNAKP